MSESNTAGMTEEQLVSGCIKADPAAQKQLYDRFSRKMFGVCLRYSASREEAEDLLQDAFLTVFEKISSYKSAGSLEGWIRRIMVNTALQHFRKQRIQWAEGSEYNDPVAPEEVNLETRELLRLIQGLPTGFRTVFNLYAIEGFTHPEIGQMLGISENTSKSQYARARAQLMIKVQRLNGAPTVR
jgi:RNA polymerase sigma factor (sigma-70 family)